MEYQDEQAKIPFYMTFPMQNMYLMEMEYEKDMERMKSLYPNEVKKLMPMIEERCDELEYEGSRIYDENPDARMMQEEVMRLYEQISGQLTATSVSMEESSGKKYSFALNPPEGWEMPAGSGDMEMSQIGRPPFPPPQRHRPPHNPPHKECDGWLCSMVGVLFQDEVYRRRCRHRRCHRWW